MLSLLCSKLLCAYPMGSVVRKRSHQQCSELLVVGHVRHGLSPTIVSRWHPMTLGVLRCVTVDDKLASFDGLVAGKAGVVHCLVGGCAVVKVREPPAAGRGIFP